MTNANECDSIRVSMEALLLLFYAWNSAPIPGTDISRCFVVLGHEFQFLINFSADKHMELTSTPASVTSCSCNLATLYLHSGKVQTSSLRNREHIIVNSSTHVDPTLRFTPLVTLFLLIAQPDLTLGEAKWTGLFIPSQVHGSSLPNSTVHPTKLSIFQQSGRTKSMHLTILLILRN